MEGEPKDDQSVPLVICIGLLLYGGLALALYIWRRMVDPAERWMVAHQRIAGPFGIVASGAGIVGAVSIVSSAILLVAMIIAAFVVLEIMVGIFVALFAIAMVS